LLPFEQAVTKIKLNTPNIPIVSTVTGLKLTDEEAVTHIGPTTRNTVKFAPCGNYAIRIR
jgi:acyl transferase domain-containing protein